MGPQSCPRRGACQAAQGSRRGRGQAGVGSNGRRGTAGRGTGCERQWLPGPRGAVHHAVFVLRGRWSPGPALSWLGDWLTLENVTCLPQRGPWDAVAPRWDGVCVTCLHPPGRGGWASPTRASRPEARPARGPRALCRRSPAGDIIDGLKCAVWWLGVELSLTSPARQVQCQGSCLRDKGLPRGRRAEGTQASAGPCPRAAVSVPQGHELWAAVLAPPGRVLRPGRPTEGAV